MGHRRNHKGKWKTFRDEHKSRAYQKFWGAAKT